jgi:hypothetical protein
VRIKRVLAPRIWRRHSDGNTVMEIKNTFHCKGKRLNLVSVMLCVLAVKLIIFLIDPTVMFFINDSSIYIKTAVSSYIPADRSFLYGFLIRWLTYSSQCLTSLIFFQVLCSAASCVLAGYILNSCLSVTPAISTVFSLLCAAAPLQLLYERYVMTETISLLLFSLFVVSALCYLRHPRVRGLFFLSLSGVFLIAFRLSYLPIVLIGAVMVPALTFVYSHDNLYESRTEGSKIRIPGSRERLVTACCHILISCVLTYGFHYGYKLINGKLSDKPPAYQYYTGFHLISSWAPLLEKADLSDPDIWGYNDLEFHYNLKDRFQRMNQRWAAYGLVSYFVRFYASRIEADKAAHESAMNILHRDPLGIVRLAFISYMDYWNVALLKETLQWDRSVREYPAELTEMLKLHYHIQGDGLWLQKTLTNQYFYRAIPWFLLILALPFVIAIVIAIDKGRHLIFLTLLGGFGLLIFINSTVLIHRNTMRFFHPDEWIILILLGALCDRIVKRKSAGTL